MGLEPSLAEALPAGTNFRVWRLYGCVKFVHVDAQLSYLISRAGWQYRDHLALLRIAC